MTDRFDAAAYGGQGWSPRTVSSAEEIGIVWRPCGQDSEWSPLKAVLLHRPGNELATVTDPQAYQYLERVELDLCQAEHDGLAQAYRDANVAVHYVEPAEIPPPNTLFVADLIFMTPEGVILARPASTVRAGEERLVARRLADLGIPIIRTVRGHGVFEGADAAWLDPQTVLLATGLRTNDAGAAQVAAVLSELGVGVVRVGLPHGAMHLMGLVRMVDRDLAIAWPGRVPFSAVQALRSRGTTVLFHPDEGERERRVGLNFVTLGPRRILMASNHPISQAFFEMAGIECTTADIGELAKAAGGIGCLTGILEREPIP